MTRSPTIRTRRPADPFQAAITATYNMRRSLLIEREIAKAAAVINKLRDDEGWKRPASRLDALAGVTEGLT